VGNLIIQQIFIVEQGGKIQMPSNESNVAHHLKDTPFRSNRKLLEIMACGLNGGQNIES
jgi:hypothetical protein